MFIWFLFGVLCCIIALLIFAWFKMVALSKNVQNTYQQLDASSKNRAGLIDSLVAAVVSLPDMSSEVLVALKDLKECPEDWDERVEREDQITRKFKAVFTTLQDHPEMLLDAAFEKLQKSIIQAEGSYRKNKNKYNNAVHSFYVFGDLIPFNWVRSAAEMESPKYFLAKDGISSAE